MNVGDKVKYSNTALRHQRDRSLGGYSQRSRDLAKQELHRLMSLVGTVVEVLENGVRVEWSNGTTCSTLDYRLERIQETDDDANL